MLTNSERQTKILANQGLVGMMAKKSLRVPYIKGSVGTFDEAYQIGMVGLCKAVDTFDSRKGFAFSTYASTIIWREITNTASDTALIRVPPSAMKKNTPKHILDKVSIAYKTMLVGENPHGKNECYKEDYNALEKDELRIELRKALVKCSDLHREVLENLFQFKCETKNQKTLIEMGKQYKYSEWIMGRIKKEALEYMKENLWHMVAYV